ncbi:MAG: hypothetical protein SGJ10_12085 [Bacteroidota bacterium]|nr:hypothetical protein [Bacteroidota bacterium]
MKSRKVVYILSLLVALSTMSCSSKKGCTDPNAINYKQKAKVDDSSCEYANTAANLKLIVVLKSLFKENSGLAWVQGRVWSFSDGGGEPALYCIDTAKGDDNENIAINGASNIDWEDIATDGKNYYIADMGNNNGDRSDLSVYIASVIDSSVLKKNNSVPSYLIHYTYPDQTDFRKSVNNNYDAEAIVYLDNYLYIFTKRHGDLHTSLYRIPAQEGTYKATLLGSFDSKGLITGADISPDKKSLVLTGFNPTSDKAFLWVLRDLKSPSLLDNKKILVDLGLRSAIGQIEGIAFVNNDSILVSNEQYKSVPPSLYGLNISAIK